MIDAPTRRRRHVERAGRALRRHRSSSSCCSSPARTSVSRWSSNSARLRTRSADRAGRRTRAPRSGGLTVAQWPKPAEGSWTEHYPELGTGRVVLRRLDARVLRARARGDLQAGVAERRPRRAAAPKPGSYFTKELADREDVDRRRARHTTARCARSTTSAATAATSWCGSDFPREETSGTCRQFTCKYHGWRYDLDGALHVRAAGGRVLRPRQGRLRPRTGALRRVGGLHLRQPRRRRRASRCASSSAR